jgi:hypothetical protein
MKESKFNSIDELMKYVEEEAQRRILENATRRGTRLVLKN